MAERTPMVKVDGYWRELPAGDTTAGASGGSSARTVTAKTADYTVTAADCAANTIFTNEGAAGTVRFTLPVNSGLTAGLHKCSFVATDAQVIEVITGQGECYFFGETAQASYTITDSAQAGSSGGLGERMDVEFLAASVWSGRAYGAWGV